MPRSGRSPFLGVAEFALAPGSSLFAGSVPTQADSRAYIRQQAATNSSGLVTGNIFDSTHGGLEHHPHSLTDQPHTGATCAILIESSGQDIVTIDPLTAGDTGLAGLNRS